MAQGVYTPDSNSANPNGTGDPNATFQLIDGVTLTGGYAGFGKADPNARDIELYKTILSGDLNGDDAQTAVRRLIPLSCQTCSAHKNGKAFDRPSREGIVTDGLVFGGTS